MFAGQSGNSVMAGCRIFKALDRDVPLAAGGRNDMMRFFDLFYQAEGLKSGMHHPDGRLWFSQPNHAHAVHKDKVPLLSVAPTILSLFGVKAPATFSGKPLAV